MKSRANKYERQKIMNLANLYRLFQQRPALREQVLEAVLESDNLFTTTEAKHLTDWLYAARQQEGP